MEEFIKDALELKKAYDNFENQSKMFNEKHRELFLDLLRRYEKATNNCMASRIGRIVKFNEYDDFEVEMLGYEGNWLTDIPNHLLFNPQFLINIEEEKKKTG